MTPDMSREGQWIDIQHKTFVNWANDQLVHSNRSVENLQTDLCDGVKLVALIEALQFRKIGKVYPKPTNRIQMLHNVSLALHAVAEDRVRLVNIGTDDIVGGNLKLILGLLWHLILRYQISSNKGKAPPKKLMLAWFQNVLPDLKINSFTSDWSDGIALHALLEFCKPGISPNWKKLSPQNGHQNVLQAMQLAKEHLGVPRVISVEDFISPDLDELSAMTYLSYFIRSNSGGYYATLNWVCRQLKNINISNLTTDWNDGYYLCALVNALGGKVKGWPNIDQKNHVATCQLGIDGARGLGVEPILTATELADPHVDHLSVMAYISRFRTVIPKESNAEMLTLNCYLLEVKVGNQTTFQLSPNNKHVNKSRVTAWVAGPSIIVNCDIKWQNDTASCTFQPKEPGNHQLFVEYDNESIKGCPVTFSVQQDVSKIHVSSDPLPYKIGQSYQMEISCPPEQADSVEVRLISPTGDLQLLNLRPTATGLGASFKPTAVGVWKYQTFAGSQEINSSEVTVFDPMKVNFSVPEYGSLGEEINCSVNLRDCGCHDLEVEVEDSSRQKLEDVTVSPMGHIFYTKFTPVALGPHQVRASVRGYPVNGSPKTIEIIDPGKVYVSGNGLAAGLKGLEAHFTVRKEGQPGKITADVEVSGQKVAVMREQRGPQEFDFCYVPSKVGKYTVNVYCNGRHVADSPYTAAITDRSYVTVVDDLTEMKDENDHIAIDYGKPTELNFDVSQAGPGTLTAEVLSPIGKLPVNVKQTPTRATASFTAMHEGDHYLHLYWQGHPLDFSPLLAYCPGPSLPVDSSKVVIFGKGAQSARSTVPAEFMIDGRKAGPGVPKVVLKGVHSDLPVEMKPLKYDRYRCNYVSNVPGGFLLYIYWSNVLLEGCPLKITITAKGEASKVKVSGEGLNGGICGDELKIFVDTTQAGPGEVTAECHSTRHSARCDIKEDRDGHYTIRIPTTEPDKHFLQIRYDRQHVPGSPFTLRVGDPPDPTKVRVFGTGIEDGLIDTYNSGFLVDTQGAGAGQLAVKIRGPKGGFRVDMRRETKSERIINCHYNPMEPGEYVINVRWSGVHVPGSPFVVHLVDTQMELDRIIRERGYIPRDEQMKFRVDV